MDDERSLGRHVLSPRAVGSVVAVSSALVVVVSTLYIADPAVGVVAAITLSVGCVGATAGLLLARRRGWSDQSWPPASEPKPSTVRRSRRTSILYGAFLLLMSLVVAVTVLLPWQRETDDVVRGWVMVGVLALAGAGSIAWGARRVPPAVVSSVRPQGASADGRGAWLRLGPSRPRGLFSWWAGASFSGLQFLVPSALGLFFPVTALQLGAWGWAQRSCSPGLCSSSCSCDAGRRRRASRGMPRVCSSARPSCRWRMSPARW